MRSVLLPKPLQNRDAFGHSNTHLHLTRSNKFQAVFRPRKLLLSLVKLWWSMRQTERKSGGRLCQVFSCQHKLLGFSWGWWTRRLRELRSVLAHRRGSGSVAWAGQLFTGWSCGQLFTYSFLCSDTLLIHPAVSRYNVIALQCCFNEIFGFWTMTQPNALEQQVNLRICAVVTSLLPWESPPLCLLQSLRFWDGSSGAVPPLFCLGFIKNHLHPVGDFPDPRLTQEWWDQD